ncbi:ATP-binding protein [Petroclostridium sp. X23]|uniref:ATP-binding protein n=1 Tax=Petroclostridium sp. X23 TaxID=3045146 RepID=UPI0024AD57B7|nr:ATP-binding protein [Petroclostridium sp. X23]WHH59216.1 ATP-binding protein [Petroclostridium sp. X23]
MKNSKNVISLHYEINGEDFSLAGEASSNVKKILKQLGVSPETIRKVSIAMYEGEINMVIHAYGGIADVDISPEQVKIVLQDEGPGIPDITLAMKEGYSTAPDTIRELGFGAGMGLPNMKKYTDHMDITSEIGKGTKVEMIVKIT